MGEYRAEIVVRLREVRIETDRLLEVANRFLKVTQNLESTDPGIRGGIAGSNPVHGEYGTYQHLNWAAKYFIDALIAQEQRWAAEGVATPEHERSVHANP